ncbi:hypothetical protein SpCBS45565_g03493 [Spizellomyces sp. 'palustris']|nr:hypothetical protein SpCBS45565_g03493 [Spizellomyces sp. 'palustris']
MSAIISPQLHDHTVKYLSTATGRDRIHRFLQYFSRFLIWHGQKNGYEKETLERLTKFMGNLGQTRKLMRVGRQIEFVRNIQKAQTLRDDVSRVTLIVKNAFLALWLFHDTCQWANTAGVVKFENIKDLSRRGMKCWLIALIASFLGDLHKLRLNSQRIQHESKVLKASQAKGLPDETAVKALKSLQIERTKIRMATLQDSLDILIPASGLEYVKVETGIVGLIGAFTSILGGSK